MSNEGRKAHLIGSGIANLAAALTSDDRERFESRWEGFANGVGRYFRRTTSTASCARCGGTNFKLEFMGSDLEKKHLTIEPT